MYISSCINQSSCTQLQSLAHSNPLNFHFLLLVWWQNMAERWILRKIKIWKFNSTRAFRDGSWLKLYCLKWQIKCVQGYHLVCSVQTGIWLIRIQWQQCDWIYQGGFLCVCSGKKLATWPQQWPWGARTLAQFNFKNRIKVSLQVPFLLVDSLKYVSARWTWAWQQPHPEVKGKIRCWKMNDKEIGSPLFPSYTVHASSSCLACSP